MADESSKLQRGENGAPTGIEEIRRLLLSPEQLQILELQRRTEDPEFNTYREAAEMPPHRLIMLRRFFQDYKQLEGKAVEVDEIRPASEAYPIILDALHRYSEERRKGFKTTH